jgi:hypothetical protein
MNELRTRLFALADEVTGELTETDYARLYRRVHGTSRRIGRRRTALAVSLAAIVTGGIVLGGAVLFAPRSNNHPNPAGTPSAGVSTPGGPSATPSNASPSEAPPKPLTAVPGTLVYLPTTTPGQQLKVTTVSNGTRRATTFGTVKPSDVAIVPAPNASLVAVVTSADTSRILPGDLIIVDPDGKRRTLAHNVRWDGGNWPLWTLDGKSIMVLLDAGWALVDAATGAVTPQSAVSGQYFTWSGNGAYRAYTPDEHQVVVTRADGTVSGRASLDGLAECQNFAACPFAVQAVSGDGRYVALGHGNTDPSHVTAAHLVLDLRTGQPVTLPQLRGSIDRIFFGTGERLIVRAGGTFYVLGPGGAVAATIPQPSDLTKATLVAYHP